MRRTVASPGLLRDARVYLSGPMDFVASRADEKKHGWRSRVGEFLRELGVTVFDPWFKPEIRGFHEYGREGTSTSQDRDTWTFDRSNKGVEVRARLAQKYWQTLHIDLRMVDTSDFLISYCPTNIYSVGTPHEIILCRTQHKPVLFVSPPVEFATLDLLKRHLSDNGDKVGYSLLERLETEVPIKSNPHATPSLWYMPLVGSERFFDGFGFSQYQETFQWPHTVLDDREESRPPRNPLLPFIETINKKLPKRWDRAAHAFVPDDDWVLWELKRRRKQGAEIQAIHQAQQRRL